MSRFIYTVSALTLCAFMTTAQASLRKEDDDKDGQYTRPGTSLVVKSGSSGGYSQAVQELLVKHAEVLKPATTLSKLDRFFCGKPTSALGFARSIFDLFANKKSDLTITDQALQFLPRDFILSVHKFQKTQTKQGLPAITTQKAELTNGTPTKYNGLLKYQTEDEGKGITFDIEVEFDLTGSTPPVLSVAKETPTGEKSHEKDDFAKELESLEKGVTHVAIYAPEGKKIETTSGGTTALRQKFILDQ